jgi:hypothetical protein
MVNERTIENTTLESQLIELDEQHETRLLVSAGNHQEEMVLLREEYEVTLASRTTQMNLAIIRMNTVGAENEVNAQRIQFLEEQVQLLQGRVHSFQSYQTDAPGF